jgi:hypothetical protein
MFVMVHTGVIPLPAGAAITWGAARPPLQLAPNTSVRQVPTPRSSKPFEEIHLALVAGAAGVALSLPVGLAIVHQRGQSDPDRVVTNVSYYLQR